LSQLLNRFHHDCTPLPRRTWKCDAIRLLRCGQGFCRSALAEHCRTFPIFGGIAQEGVKPLPCREMRKLVSNCST
jgi:hypothetical protein